MYPTMEPAASPKTMSPISKVLAPSESRMAGVRATPLAIPTPHNAKIPKTALRRATICGRVSGDPVRWADATAGWDSAPSGCRCRRREFGRLVVMLRFDPWVLGLRWPASWWW